MQFRFFSTRFYPRWAYFLQRGPLGGWRGWGPAISPFPDSPIFPSSELDPPGMARFIYKIFLKKFRAFPGTWRHRPLVTSATKKNKSSHLAGKIVWRQKKLSRGSFQPGSSALEDSSRQSPTHAHKQTYTYNTHMDTHTYIQTHMHTY